MTKYSLQEFRDFTGPTLARHYADLAENVRKDAPERERYHLGSRPLLG
jgi:hypothetical protein